MLALALAATWVVVGTHPAVAGAGSSWQDAAFVEVPGPGERADGFVDEQDESWTAWDTEDGAWASISMQNTRPYPIDVTAVYQGPGVEARVAAVDGWRSVGMIDLGSLEPTEQLTVPAHGLFAVLMHVSDRCLLSAAGTSYGTDSVRLDVRSLGLHAALDVTFPTTFMAGRTTGHVPAADCPPLGP
jgi:hypothetical protein